jgi:hypothetical protein
MSLCDHLLFIYGCECQGTANGLKGDYDDESATKCDLTTSDSAGDSFRCMTKMVEHDDSQVFEASYYSIRKYNKWYDNGLKFESVFGIVLPYSSSVDYITKVNQMN